MQSGKALDRRIKAHKSSSELCVLKKKLFRVKNQRFENFDAIDKDQIGVLEMIVIGHCTD